MVDRLFDAIKDRRVVCGALQTDDAALQKAYQIVTEGVRIAVGYFSWAEFDLDEGRAVAGRRVHDVGRHWHDSDDRSLCALFGASPAEFK